MYAQQGLNSYTIAAAGASPMGDETVFYPAGSYTLPTTYSVPITNYITPSISYKYTGYTTPASSYTVPLTGYYPTPNGWIRRSYQPAYQQPAYQTYQQLTDEKDSQIRELREQVTALRAAIQAQSQQYEQRIREVESRESRQRQSLFEPEQGEKTIRRIELSD